MPRAFLGFRDFLFGEPRTEQHCYDCQYRRIDHGTEQRYVSPTTGKCRRLVVQAVHPQHGNLERTEACLGQSTPKTRKLALWLACHDLFHPLWLVRWIWFILALIWPFGGPSHTGLYPAYLSRYYGQLWAARSPREYSLRAEKLGAEPIEETTHSPYPRKLIIYDSASECWDVCSDPNIIKKQRYVAISYRYDDIVPEGVDEATRLRLQESFITKVQAIVTSLDESAYWIDLTLVDKASSPEETNKDLYCMADVYRAAQFTLIMLSPPTGITEEEAWKGYGERLWTLPEALLSRELRFQFRDGQVTPITLHQLANRAYAHLAEESAIVNSYALRDPLERLERLSMLKSALWRRTSRTLQHLEVDKEAEPRFRGERVYALMGFFSHRIHPQFQETEIQALVRLSMANDNDRIVERMISLLPRRIPDTASWYAEEDEWGANLWDIDPEIQVVGLTEREGLVLGGCRAAAIRWKDFPSVAFATRRSITRLIASHLPFLFWEFLAFGISLISSVSINAAVGNTAAVDAAVANAAVANMAVANAAYAILSVALALMLFAPYLVAYGVSGRIVHAQPWLVGVKGLISHEEASDLMYGGAISSVPRTSYTPSGTPLARTSKGQFRSGDPEQLKVLQAIARAEGGDNEDDNLYTLVDTVSATIYYFRAERPPTVCLFTGRESGMGRFVLCSERCTVNELHKETVIRMPWYVSQSMAACDWIAVN